MSTEFTKKVINTNETRYILEMTAGATGSSAIASMPKDMGEVQSRTGTVPQKPRQGPLRPQTGGGSHRDKKKEQKKGQEKHKKPYFENDHEISMASNELLSIVKDAKELLMLVRRYSEMEGLEAWQQSKITKAADYLAAVLRSISGDQAFPENVQISEAFQNDEANVMYVYDVSRGQIMQKSVRNDQERSAYAQGYRFEPEQALRAHNIIRSKFNPNKFVQKQGTKWVEVFPFGKPSDQGMSEGSNHSIEIDGKEVDSTSIEVDGVDPRDYPDFSDAYLSYAEFVDGTPLNDEQLDQLNNDYPDLIYDLAYDSLHEGVTEDSDISDQIKISLKVNQDSTVDVTAMLDGEEVGHVNFDDSEGELIPQDLYVEPEYRGQGIAAAMYNYTKSKGYTILRGEEQTDDAIGLWNKHRPGKDVWEQGVAEGSSDNLRSNVLDVLLTIYHGAINDEDMTDTISDELGQYFAAVEASNDPKLQKVYAYVRELADADLDIQASGTLKAMKKLMGQTYTPPPPSAAADDTAFGDLAGNFAAAMASHGIKAHPDWKKKDKGVAEGDFDKWGGEIKTPNPDRKQFKQPSSPAKLARQQAADRQRKKSAKASEMAEDFTDDVGNIYAMHPQPEKSEKIAFLITGMTEDDFSDRWTDLPDPYQQEFGYDLPLWDTDDLGSYQKIAVKPITFDQYVQLVGNYIKSEELAGSAMSKMKQGVAEGKIKGVDGKACWKGKRYAGREKKADGTYKDICVPVGEDEYFGELALSLAEKLDPNAPAEVWIQDFLKSNAPSVRGKPKSKRIEQALAAKYQAMNPSKKKKKK